MTAPERELSFVSYNGPDGIENHYYNADDNTRIYMRRDGAGPMGWFDVVHVEKYGQPFAAIPFHQCNEVGFPDPSICDTGEPK